MEKLICIIPFVLFSFYLKGLKSSMGSCRGCDFLKPMNWYPQISIQPTNYWQNYPATYKEFWALNTHKTSAYSLGCLSILHHVSHRLASTLNLAGLLVEFLLIFTWRMQWMGNNSLLNLLLMYQQVILFKSIP